MVTSDSIRRKRNYAIYTAGKETEGLRVVWGAGRSVSSISSLDLCPPRAVARERIALVVEPNAYPAAFNSS